MDKKQRLIEALKYAIECPAIHGCGVTFDVAVEAVVDILLEPPALEDRPGIEVYEIKDDRQ